jgi:asparagine synthase (glutamine-hydrolysing)
MSFRSPAGRLTSAARERIATAFDPGARRLVRQVRQRRITYLQPTALLGLHRRVRALESSGVPGLIIEAGTALGGSAVVLAAAKAATRPLQVYDVFGMIPPPGDHDGRDVWDRYDAIKAGRAKGFGTDTYYGYQEDLKSKVVGAFIEFGYPPETNSISLHEGLFEATLHPDQPVALAHIDGDWYSSVRTCLDRIWPVLSPGGALVIDDYGAWSGATDAVDDFLRTITGYRLERWARLHIIKT